ncbi:uncharacterized protein LOC141903425 [Tubulanus polymorphus]|uniref:uncharacterized protein LOC141903425 n=1 Tax=Tubulanus polymorphus TaxID=672921 RepID=UPI003DA51F69
MGKTKNAATKTEKEVVRYQNLDRKLMFHVRGVVPLSAVSSFASSYESTSIEEIHFPAESHITDAVIEILSQQKLDWSELRYVNLGGCLSLTEYGINCLCDILCQSNQLETVDLKHFQRISDKTLIKIAASVTSDYINVLIDGTDITHIPPDINRYNLLNLQFNHCPILSPSDGELELFHVPYSHVIICPSDELEYSVTDYLTTGELNTIQDVGYARDFIISEQHLTLTELKLHHPWFEYLSPRRPSQVIIPFDSSLKESEINEHIQKVVHHFITKGPVLSDVQLMYGVKVFELRNCSVVDDLIKFEDDGEIVIDYELDLENKNRKWHVKLESCDREETAAKFYLYVMKNGKPDKISGMSLDMRTSDEIIFSFDEESDEAILTVVNRGKIYTESIKDADDEKIYPGLSVKRACTLRAMTLSPIVQKPAENESLWSGYKFMLVPVITNGDNSKTKMSHHSNIDWEPYIDQLTKYIDLQKSEMSNDRLNQIQLSEALKQRSNIIHFERDLNSFFSQELDFKTGVGRDEILQKLASNARLDQKTTPYKHQVSSDTYTALTQMINGMNQRSSWLTKLDEFTENPTSEFAANKINHPHKWKLVELLQEWGLCLLLPYKGLTLIITDPKKFYSTLNSLSILDEIPHADISCLPDNVKGITNSRMFQLLVDIGSSKLTQAVADTLSYIGPLMALPCLCTSEDDVKYIWTTVKHITEPVVSIEKYRNVDKSENISTKSSTYSLYGSIPLTFMTSLTTLVSNFFQFTVVWNSGYVIHIGAMEVFVIQNDGEISIQVSTADLSANIDDENMKMKEMKLIERQLNSLLFINIELVEFVLLKAGIFFKATKFLGNDKVYYPSICSKHQWKRPAVSGSDNLPHISVCTLCQNCTYRGRDCPQNGIPCDVYRQCMCNTEVSFGCWDCGICQRCAEKLWEIHTYLNPSLGESSFPALGADVLDIVLIPVPISPLNNEFAINLYGESAPQVGLNNFNGAMELFPVEWSGIGARLDLKFFWPQENVKPNRQINSAQPDLYQTSIKRRVHLCQALGIAAYTPLSSRPMVGLIAAKCPFTPEHNSFKIRILSRGSKGTMSIGFVPKDYADDNQVGWRSFSVGYHGDDGGVYLSSGWAKRTMEEWHIGDVIECGIDFNHDATKSIYFSYNDKKTYVLTGVDRLPKDLYPAIGFHSSRESVELLTPATWRPHDIAQPDPTTFVDHNTRIIDDNLMICPNYELYFDPRYDTIEDSNSGFGVIFLKNVSEKDLEIAITDVSGNSEIEFKFDSPITVKAASHKVIHVGIQFENSSEAKSLMKEALLKLQWRENEESEFTADNKHTFRCNWSGIEVKSLIERWAHGSKYKEDSVIAELRMNNEVISHFFVRDHSPLYLYVDRRRCKDEEGAFIHAPKVPKVEFPFEIEKGMYVAYLKDDQPVVSHPDFSMINLMMLKDDVSEDGEMNLMPVSVTEKSITIQTAVRQTERMYCVAVTENLIKSFKHGIDILFKMAPPTLFSQTQLHPTAAWRGIYRKGHSCSKAPWLVTTSEANNVKVTVDYLLQTVLRDSISYSVVAFLPAELNQEKLLYPSLLDFTDINRLAGYPLCFCRIVNRTPVMASTENVNLGIDRFIPHFIDHSGIKPVLPATENINLIFRSIESYWAYSVISKEKLKLASYDRMLQGEPMKVNQVESGLKKILTIFASITHALCGQYKSIHDIPEGDMYEKICANDVDTYIPEISVGIEGFRRDQLVHNGIESLCSAHYFATPNSLTTAPKDDSVQMNPQILSPYESYVHMLHWDLTGTTVYPNDMFYRMPNLQVLHLENACDIHENPIPDILSCKKLNHISITNSNLAEIPNSWANFQLKSMNITSSRISEIPTFMANLNALEALTLEYNQIYKLADNLDRLVHLKNLTITGVLPDSSFWCSDILRRDWYKMHGNNLDKLLGVQKLNELFDKCDLDNNNILDPTEIPAFTAELFYAVYRFGLEWSENGPQAALGGFPVEVCSISSLVHLSLKNHAFRHVHASIAYLKNLRTLILDENPLLETLPASMADMKKLVDISVRGCSSLKTPPLEICRRGRDPIIAYLKYLSASYSECHRTKLMLVGLGGAGKTSLLRALTSKTGKTKQIEGEEITNGIDIGTWNVSSTDQSHTVYFSTWDFAGQTVYYNTHQFFLSSRAVYLLLWTTRLGWEHAGLDFWLSSISCHAPKAPIFIIGTHADLVHKKEIPEQALKERYPQIAGFHFTSAILGQGISDLKEAIVLEASKQSYMGERIPEMWLSFESKIIKKRDETSVMAWEDVEEMALETGIYEEKDIRQAVMFLHELGTVQYFNSEFLRDRVVVNPQWIVDVMSSVVSVKESAIVDGIFNHSDMSIVWDKEPPELYNWLIRLTEKFDLTFPMPNEYANMVPCLLPTHKPELIEWPVISEGSDVRETKMVYEFQYLPAGLFNRAQVRLFEFSDSRGIWKQGSLLKKNDHIALVQQINDKTLVIRVQGLRPQNILFLIHEIIENLVLESFNGVKYDLFLPCPDCIDKNGTKDPALLEQRLIKKALKMNAPFLQCRKYFHVISMSELQAVFPPDSSQEFDIQFGKLVQNLQDLRNELSADVFILSCNTCGKDDPSVVSAEQVKNDLEKDGYKVLMSGEMNVQDIALSIKDSKVVVIFASKEFNENEQCCQFVSYTRDMLRKPSVLCLHGNDSSWLKGGDSGALSMMIGPDEVYVNFIQAEQYNAKLVELKKQIDLRISQSKSQEAITPQVFLSYCWTNSKMAVEAHGLHKNELALGWGDPRALKQYLEENGISCWLDIEQNMTRLFEDLCEGIKKTDIIVACVSDEYAESDNCMMELRFAIGTLKKPAVFIVVGTGDDWEWTEIGILKDRLRSPKVDFREESNHSYEKLMKHVQLQLKAAKENRHQTKKPSAATQKKIPKKEEKKIAFKEDYELLQRKFQRQIAIFAQTMNIVYPRLIIVDFLEESELKQQESKRDEELNEAEAARKAEQIRLEQEEQQLAQQQEMSDLINREEITLQRQSELIDDEREEEDEWKSSKFCFRILCENEQGWHCHGKPLPYLVSQERRILFLTLVAPYLYRIYNLLKNSGIQLHCLGDSVKAQKFLEFIKEHASGEFQAAYRHCRDAVHNYDPGRQLGSLQRCYLPSGKINWLCETDHQKLRVCILSSDDPGSVNASNIVNDSDIRLRVALTDDPDRMATVARRYQSIIKGNLLKKPPPVPTIERVVSDTKRPVLTKRSSSLLVRPIAPAKLGDEFEPEEDSVKEEQEQQEPIRRASETSRRVKAKRRMKAAGNAALAAARYEHQQSDETSNKTESSSKVCNIS